MKKRFTLGFLSFLMLLFSFVALVSCDEDSTDNNNPSTQECVHDWGAWEVTKSATCTDAGEEKRICSKCEEFELRGIEKLAHDYNPATCTEAKKCKECGATDGKALGHTWVAADCDSAKTCSVCNVTEGEALGHTWVDADCDTAKTCSVCNVTEGEALGHTWVAADCDTAKTCSVCGTTEGEALGHTWVDADCDTAKTCSVCNATEGEALGHKWDTLDCESVKQCTVCGEIDDTITEHDLEKKIIILDNIVSCGASAEVMQCKKCEAIVEVLDFDNDCENGDYDEIDIDQDGYSGYSQIMICDDCGCTLKYTYLEKLLDLCHFEAIEEYSVYLNEEKNRTISYSYTDTCHDTVEEYELNGTACEDGYIIHYNCENCEYTEQSDVFYDHIFDDNVPPQNIDLSTLGACGGHVEYLECVVCDADVLYDIHPDCHEFSSHNSTENVDADGITHYINEVTCNACNITYIQEQYSIPYASECYEIEYTIYTIKSGQEVLLTLGNNSYYTYHDLEITSELLGDSCIDGYYIYGKCKYCDYEEEETIYEHTYESESLYAEYGCGSGVEYGECEVCGLTIIDYIDDNCGLYECTPSKETIDGVEYTTTSYSCPSCEFSYTKKSWTQIDGCIHKNISELVFYYADDKLLEGVKVEQNTIHTLNVTKEFTTAVEDCNSGVHALLECENCDYSVTYDDSHYFIDYHETLDITGFCGASVDYSQCIICQKIDNQSFYEECCDTHECEAPAGYEGYEGYQCNDCNAMFLQKTEKSEPLNCEQIITITKIVLFNDEKIYESVDQYTESAHDMEYEYTMLGDDCDDGYIEKGNCKNCDYQYENECYGHNTEDISITHPDACEEFIFSYTHCKVCDKTFGYNLYCINCEISNEGGITECSACQMRYEDVVVDIRKEGCQKITTYSVKLSIGENELFADEFVSQEIEHTIEYTGNRLEATCESGLHVVASCSVCGHIDFEETYYDHYKVDTRDDLSHLGLCGEISYFESKCVGCNKVFAADLNHSCSLIDSKCENCEFTIEYSDNPGLVNGDCERFVGRTITILNPEGEEVYSKETGFYETDLHDYQYDAELLPGSVSCDDGVLVTMTCSRCDWTNEYETVGHTSNKVKVDLTQYGVCEQVELYEWICCSCDMVTDVQIYNNCWSQYVDDGDDTTEVYSCDACSTKYKFYYTDADDKDSECYLTRTYHYEIYSNADELLFSTEFSQREQMHYFELTRTLLGESCTDGVYEESKCKDCGCVDHVNTYYAHILIPEYIYPENACEDSYYVLQQCVCKHESEFVTSGCFYMSDSGTDESGEYEVDYYIYTCYYEQCKISIRDENYLIDENIGHRKSTVYDDGVLIDTIEYDIYYSDMGGLGGQ